MCVCVRSALPQWQRAKKGSFARAKKSILAGKGRENILYYHHHVLPVFNLWQLRVCVCVWKRRGKLQGGKKSLVCLIFGPSGTEGDHIRFAYQTTCTYSPSFPSPLFRFIFPLYRRRSLNTPQSRRLGAGRILARNVNVKSSPKPNIIYFSLFWKPL